MIARPTDNELGSMFCLFKVILAEVLAAMLALLDAALVIVLRVRAEAEFNTDIVEILW